MCRSSSLRSSRRACCWCRTHRSGLVHFDVVGLVLVLAAMGLVCAALIEVSVWPAIFVWLLLAAGACLAALFILHARRHPEPVIFFSAGRGARHHSRTAQRRDCVAILRPRQRTRGKASHVAGWSSVVRPGGHLAAAGWRWRSPGVPGGDPAQSRLMGCRQRTDPADAVRWCRRRADSRPCARRGATGVASFDAACAIVLVSAVLNGRSRAPLSAQPTRVRTDCRSARAGGDLRSAALHYTSCPAASPPARVASYAADAGRSEERRGG